MIVWIIALLITTIILKQGKIETKPAKLAFGSLVLNTAASLISIPFVLLLGHTDIIADPWSVSSLVIGLLLSAWFFFVKSKLSMVAICIYSAFCAVGIVIALSSLPMELWLGTAASGVVAVVGLVSGIYCLCTWSTSVPKRAKAEMLGVFE
ncbi:MAG: hypothetical protein J2P54_04705 [Bradyrhizobiaceae bacterium]|nr:hypothetical protein [Bradyrhizobiaceae bacterium]